MVGWMDGWNRDQRVCGWMEADRIEQSLMIGAGDGIGVAAKQELNIWSLADHGISLTLRIDNNPTNRPPAYQRQ